MTRLTCWLVGHDWLRRHAEHRVYLRCDRCGQETPGLRDDDGPTPRVLYAAPVRRKFKVLKTKKARTA